MSSEPSDETPVESAADPSPMARPGRLELVGAALFLPTVMFVNKVNNIILPNLYDWPYDPRTLVPFLAGFVGTAGLCLWVFLATERRRWCVGAARAAIGLGTAILLWGAVHSLAERRPLRFPVLVGLDEAVLVLAAILGTRLPWRWLTRGFAFVGTALLLTGVYNHGTGVRQHQRMLAARAPVVPTPSGTAPAGAGAAGSAHATGNIYHIMLDGFQKEVFAILRDRDPSLQPAGFTYYPHFMSNYALTRHSMAAVLTGRYFQAGADRRAWLGEARIGGLYRDLAAHGVRITQYLYFQDRDCSPHAAGGCYSPWDGERDTPELREQRRQRQHWLRTERRHDAIDFWVTSIVPRSIHAYLRREYLAQTTWAGLPQLGDAAAFPIMATLGLREKSPRGEPGGRAFPYWSAQQFQQFLRDEAGRPPTGQYVYFHAILPHFPYMLGADCSNQGWTTGSAQDRYLAQAECALRLVGKLTERLAELDRLEDALIIVHADHGAFSPVLPGLVEQYSAWFDPGAAAALAATPGLIGDDGLSTGGTAPDPATFTGLAAFRSAALLLVKPPGGGPHNSPVPANSLDIAPTVYAHVNLPPPGLGGYPLTAFPADLQRAAPFYLWPGGDTTDPRRDVARTSGFLAYERENGVWVYRGTLPAR